MDKNITCEKTSSINKRDLVAELRGAIQEVKESVEGKRSLNTLDNLINELRNSK
jgi:hypothetical protein